MNKVISISISFSLAIKSAFLPKLISIPQRAMLVAMVTPPRQPFCATISASHPSSQALHKGYTTKVCKSDILINKINKVYNPCTVQWHVEIAYGQQLSGFIVCSSRKNIYSTWWGIEASVKYSGDLCTAPHLWCPQAWDALFYAW